jgi:TPR repeat protein
LVSALAFAATPPAELKDAAGNAIIKYVVEPPDSFAPAGTTDPARQLGLILCFPEHDRPVGDEIYPVREALKRLGLRDGYVLLAGGPKERKFGPQDHEPIAKLIEWAKKTYPINPRRVYMYGKGEGGKISGELTMFHPDVITASISYSWSWWKMPAETTKAIDPIHTAPEFYMVLGLRDLSYHLTNVRDGFSRVNAKGYHVIYREFEDLGARTYHQPSNDDAIGWATRLRNKTLPLSAEERALLAAPPKVNHDGYFASLALVGGAPAGAVLEKLLASSDAKVRAAAATTFNHGIFGEAAVSSLGTRLTDSSLAVRRAAARALAIQANWRSQAAQEALTQFLADPAKAVDPADRVSAADAIVEAARYQIKGARQDAILFRSLVAMLEDTDEEIRTIANNTLMPVRDREFRGDLGRPERKAPEGGWAAWLSEVTARADAYRRGYSNCGKPENAAAALFCEGGRAAATDPARGFDLTRQAAEQGYHPAEAMLGIMYVVGKGVEQNNPEGAKWLAKAADSGDTIAAFNAMMLYAGSPGIKKDPVLTEKYLKIYESQTRLP